MMTILLLGAVSGDWPQFGGDLGSTFFQRLTGAISSPVLKWQKSGGFQIASASVSDVDGDGRTEVLAGTAARTVYCFDGATGAPEWSFADTSWDWWMWATPAVGDINGDGSLEVVVCASGSQNFGRIYYLRGSDGLLLWWATQVDQYTFASFDASPKLADVDGDGADEIICADISGRAYCLEGNGTLKWSFGPNDGAFYAIALGDLDGDGVLEVALLDNGGDDQVSDVYVLDARSGTLKWNAELPEYGGLRCLAIADVDGDGANEVVAGCQEYLVCYEGDGTQRWQASLPSHSATRPAAVGDFDGDGKVEVVTLVGVELQAFDGVSGTLKWAVPIPQGASSSMGGPAASDLDGDGSFEFLVHTLFEDPNILYAMTSVGYDWAYTTSSGFLGYGGIVADVDDDSCVEIVCSTDGALYVLDDPAGSSGCGFLEEKETEPGEEKVKLMAGLNGEFNLWLPKASNVALRAYRADGRLLWSWSGLLKEGLHRFRLPETCKGGAVILKLRTSFGASGELVLTF